jgi:hypothetical protein
MIMWACELCLVERLVADPGDRALEVCGRSLSGVGVRIPSGAWMSVSCECCVLCRYRTLRTADPWSRGVLPIVCVIRCNNNSLHQQLVDRSSQTKK